MLATLEGPITAKAEQIRIRFQAFLDKTNKENPRPQDVARAGLNLQPVAAPRESIHANDEHCCPKRLI